MQSGHQAFGLSFRDTHGTPSEIRDEAFAETIRSIPRGKVASYGQVAAAARSPRYHRAVARLLKTMIPGELPWQRVLGAGGEIKLAGRAAAEQRLRLRMEGVTFVGKRIDLNLHQYVFELEQTLEPETRARTGGRPRAKAGC
jgi:methylated-DNA-protein-cysteine methyltransferase related protein